MYPTGTHSPLIAIIERATKSCLLIEKYKHDTRYVTLWLTYVKYNYFKG